jgi:acetyl-CoA carboxylase biotin carboxyl carrier protein
MGQSEPPDEGGAADGQPNVTAVRALALLCQRSGVYELEASVGSWSIRLLLDQSLPQAASEEVSSDDLAQDGSTAHIVYSEWVGVFRRALDIDKPALAYEGQPVREGDVVGLIEAMQLLHEQRSDRTGTVTRFLIEDGAAVEYGQPLLEIE